MAEERRFRSHIATRSNFSLFDIYVFTIYEPRDKITFVRAMINERIAGLELVQRLEKGQPACFWARLQDLKDIRDMLKIVHDACPVMKKETTE